MNSVFKRLLPALLLITSLGLMTTAGTVAQSVPSCTSFGSSSSTQVNCSIDAGGALTVPNTLFVVATSPAGTTPANCSAQPTSSYTVQGSVANVPATPVTIAITGIGSTGCKLQLQSGAAPAGASLGDIGLTLPAAVTSGTTIQFSTLVCTDPTCVSLLSTQPISATVTQDSGGGSNYCSRDHHDPGDGHNGGCNGGYRGPNPCQYGASASPYCQPGGQYCNGISIPAGQTCNTTYCPSGQYTGIGQTCPTSGVSVTYPAGWNIVAGPTGTVLPGVAGALYSLPPGVTSYLTLPGTSPLQAGTGYWAYFNASTTITLPVASSTSVTVQLTPNQYALIGNPGNTTATVSGTSLSVLLYSPTGGGYTPMMQLPPGQGAWVASPYGGAVTITSGVSPYQPPPPPPPL